MDTEEGQRATFSRWFSQKLKSNEMTAADFARRSGIDTGSISRWRKGTRLPSPEMCDRIAESLNVSLDLVLAMAGHRPPMFEVSPESPEGQLVPIIRQMTWTDERLEQFKNQLLFWIDYDREHKSGT